MGNSGYLGSFVTRRGWNAGFGVNKPGVHYGGIQRECWGPVEVPEVHIERLRAVWHIM